MTRDPHGTSRGDCNVGGVRYTFLFIWSCKAYSIELALPPALLAWSGGAGEDPFMGGRLRLRDAAGPEAGVSCTTESRGAEVEGSGVDTESGGGGEDPSARMMSGGTQRNAAAAASSARRVRLGPCRQRANIRSAQIGNWFRKSCRPAGW